MLWIAAAILLLGALVVGDLSTGSDVVLIPLYAAAPLLVSLGGRLRATAAIGVLAFGMAVAVSADLGRLDVEQTIVQVTVVALSANLAVWAAFLRERLERALVRERFLARAGELLADVHDYRRTLARVAELAVPDVVDWAAVDLLHPDHSIERVGVAHADPGKVALARQLQERYPSTYDAPSGLGKVLRTAEPEFLPRIPRDRLEQAARDEEHLRLIRALDPRGGLTVPLVGREGTLGALTWVTAGGGRTLSRDDLALAQELAARCALIVDNARLLDDRRRAEAELAEAFGLLDVIFEHAPVGLALFDRDLRYVRVNDRLTEINGIPAAETLGRTVGEVLPNMDPEVESAFRRVLEDSEPARDLEVVGETPAEPGMMRTWLLSCWPVRRRGEEAVIGVGAVVVEVTAERAAARALRAQTDRYETLLLALSEVGEGMIVVEDDRLVYANPAFEAMTGYALEELRAMEDVFELTAEPGREEARSRARARVQEGIVDPSYAVTVRRRDGELIELELAGVPLSIDERRQLVIVGRDITARRRAEAERAAALRRTEFLAEASERFDEVLDPEHTLQIAATLAVRDFADGCVIELGDGTTARAGLGPEVAPVAVDVPLSARGQHLGTMALGFLEAPGDERERELQATFSDLARRAGLAVDNARLYQERAAVARTLQRSLLPPELPEVPGMQVAARYVAAGEGNEVGGDFYDCFATGPGEWALVIGDVCGKGAEAAAITALARYTIRASVLHSRDPSLVLTELNEAILRQSLDYRFCTVLYAAVSPTPEGVRALLATGGHPLPYVVRTDGSVEMVGRTGTLLGIVPEPQIDAQAVLLRPGDALVLYTDGVIEASPTDDRFGPERLAEFLAALAGRDAAAIAREIEREVLAVQGGRLRDDVAVLVARVVEDAGRPFVAITEGVAASA